MNLDHADRATHSEGPGRYVMTTDFDFDSLDRNGHFRSPDADRAACETVVRILSIVMEARNPRMRAHQLVWGLGMSMRNGEALKAVAKRYNVSPQAFAKGAALLLAELGMHVKPGYRVKAWRRGTAPQPKRRVGYGLAAWALKGARMLNAFERSLPTREWSPEQRASVKRLLEPMARIWIKL
mgnify:CR=1 FL=1